MYFLDINILAKQLLPPTWRTSKKLQFFTTVLIPFNHILSDFKIFRKETKSRVNLSSQVIIIEEHVKNITGIKSGVDIIDGEQKNEFILKLPAAGMLYEKKIRLFLKKKVPTGITYELIFEN